MNTCGQLIFKYPFWSAEHYNGINMLEHWKILCCCSYNDWPSHGECVTKLRRNVMAADTTSNLAKSSVAAFLAICILCCPCTATTIYFAIDLCACTLVPFIYFKVRIDWERCVIFVFMCFRRSIVSRNTVENYLMGKGN